MVGAVERPAFLNGVDAIFCFTLGGLLLPALLADRYRERFSLGLLTAAGSLGLVLASPLAQSLISSGGW